MKIRSIATAAVAATAMMMTFTDAAWARMNSLEYTVLRDGSDIGTHTVTINEDGGKTSVAIKSDIKVKVLFVTAYEYTQTASEVWENGKLVALSSQTHDDNAPGGSKKWTTTVESNGASLKINAVDDVAGAEKVSATVAADLLPASLWNAETVKQSALLNTILGTVMTVTVEDKGAEEVPVKGANVSATHYSITGGLQRELWIDADGNVVKYTFEDSTGSEIAYVLQ